MFKEDPIKTDGSMQQRGLMKDTFNNQETYISGSDFAFFFFFKFFKIFFFFFFFFFETLYISSLFVGVPN